MKKVFSLGIGLVISLALIPSIEAERELNNIADAYLVNVAELPTIDLQNELVEIPTREPKLAEIERYEVIEVSEVETEEPMVSLGEFKITYYCACKLCCGKDESHPAYGITASGTRVEEGRTIATDPSVIPMGATVSIGGHEYVAEDTGKSIIGNCIDIYIADHQKCLEMGVDYMEVFGTGMIDVD